MGAIAPFRGVNLSMISIYPVCPSVIIWSVSVYLIVACFARGPASARYNSCVGIFIHRFDQDSPPSDGCRRPPPQVSCATTLERALRNILRDIVIADKSTRGHRSSTPPPYPDGGGEVYVPPRGAPGNDIAAPPVPVAPSAAAPPPPLEEETATEPEGEADGTSRARERGSRSVSVDATSPAAAAAAAGRKTTEAGAGASFALEAVTGRNAEDQTGGGGGGGRGQGEAGTRGRRSVSFADPALSCPPADNEEEAPSAVEPSAPPSILRRSREPEREEGGGSAGGPVGGSVTVKGGGAAAEEEEGRGSFSRGKPPVFRRNRSREARDSGGGGGRRKNVRGQHGGGGPGGGGRRGHGSPTAVEAGVHVGIPGRVVLDGCCLLLRVFSMAAFLVVSVLEAEIVWTPLANET